MRALATSRLVLEPQVARHADEMFTLLQDPARAGSAARVKQTNVSGEEPWRVESTKSS